MRGNPRDVHHHARIVGSIPRMRGNHSRSRLAMVCRRSIPAHAGNRALVRLYNETVWSIPAHAGQPCLDSSTARGYRVYPRACGATWLYALCRIQRFGLSPRMRGNLLETARQRQLRRSIPRMRGNPVFALLNYAYCRSIPAHAGQPQWTNG